MTSVPVAGRLDGDANACWNRVGGVAGDSAGATRSDAVLRSAASRGKKTLIVDDPLRNVFALSGLLRKRGLEVIVADNGQMALERLDENPGIDAVLMDIMMPVMDGFEAMRRIRGDERFRNLPVIAVTAKAMAEDRRRCMEAGASDYLSKPIELDALLAMLRVWLGRTT